MINCEGIASKASFPNSMVLHSEWPQTEQHGVLATPALNQSSIALSPIQTRFDWEGSASKEVLSISLVSKDGSIPKGRRTSLSFSRACWSPSYVALHRSQVRPRASTSLCQTIGSDFIFMLNERYSTRHNRSLSFIFQRHMPQLNERQLSAKSISNRASHWRR